LDRASLLRPMHQMWRTLALARTGAHAQATAEIDRLVQQSGDDPHYAGEVRRTAAAVHAVAAREVRCDARLPEPERAARSERHAARAVALLREAAGAGSDLRGARDDADFDALRARADFQKLFEGGAK